MKKNCVDHIIINHWFPKTNLRSRITENNAQLTIPPIQTRKNIPLQLSFADPEFTQHQKIDLPWGAEYNYRLMRPKQAHLT